MVSRRGSSFVLALVMGLVTLLIAFGQMEMSRTVALARTETGRATWSPSAQPPPPDDDDLMFFAYFPDEDSIQVTDLAGNIIGEGTHGGEVKCNGNTCSHKTDLVFDWMVASPIPLHLEYRFTTRQAFDPEEERAVVAGLGTLSNNGQKQGFSFTATFQNNWDGTVSVTYSASRPDASFIIPRAPGEFMSGRVLCDPRGQCPR
jgi:hypothetical protein